MRKEVFVTLVDDGAERLFKIKQMPAVKQERIINRTISLLLGGGAVNKTNLSKLQNNIKKENWSDIMAILGSIDYEKIEPLYNELLECCEHIPEKNNRNFGIKMNADNIDTVISEVKNLYRLRIEAFKVNFAFFSQGEASQTQKPTTDIQILKNT